MIKILGGFVRFNGERKFAGDVFSSTEEHEAALVREGFAVYVDKSKKADKKPEEKPEENNNGLGDGQEGQQPEENEEFDEAKAKKLTVDQLKALANTYGISEEEMVLEDGKNKTKAEIIELIKGAIESQADNGDDNFNGLGDGQEGIV